MKKAILFFCVFLCLAVPCNAAESHYQLMVNAKLTKTKFPVLEENGEIFLSLSDAVCLLEEDYEVKQNKTDRSALILANGQYCYIKEGRLFWIMNNQVNCFSRPPFYRQEELYLPASSCAGITGHYFIKSKSYLQFFKW